MNRKLGMDLRRPLLRAPWYEMWDATDGGTIYRNKSGSLCLRPILDYLLEERWPGGSGWESNPPPAVRGPLVLKTREATRLHSLPQAMISCDAMR